MPPVALVWFTDAAAAALAETHSGTLYRYPGPYDTRHSARKDQQHQHTTYKSKALLV